MPTNIKTIFPDPADILNFELTIDPDEGRSDGLSPYLFRHLGVAGLRSVWICDLRGDSSLRWLEVSG